MNVALFLEIKNEYTEHLTDTITPYIYEGLTSIYKEAVRLADEINREGNTLMIFQKLLQSINNWSQLRIEEETNRIKQLSNTADYLDDLIRAVVKSNIILLTYSNSVSNVIAQSFYNTLTTSTFIHRCYTECGKDAHNNPYLFFHDVDPMDYKRNQIIINQHIQAGITRAIRKILPISMILKEYLVNSINIIQEPPKVELIGSNQQVIPDTLGPQLDNFGRINPFGSKNISENKLDSKLEKEVMKIIKSESAKSEQQTVQAILNIDKILTNMKPNNPAELSAKSSSNKRVLSSINKKNSEFLIAPHLMEQEDKEFCDDIMNDKLGQSDKKILNINFDDEPTVSASTNKKSISGTTMSNRPMPGKTGPKMNPLTSERIDPSKVNLIEDYGSHIGSKRNVAGRRK